ncbi:MAG: muconolactone Delta-isomerase family protein [Chloroflexia bacterium]
MKFLVMWELELSRLTMDAVHAVMRMPEYAGKLTDQGKLEKRWHIVGKHGGAWVYDVTSNEELERLLAMAPVYNFAHYDIYPLAEMESPANILQPPDQPAP